VTTALEPRQGRIDRVKLLGGLLLLLGATAVILMGTVGAARAALAHPGAAVSGVVIANGFTADCAITDGLGAVSAGSCDAAAARITASSDAAKFPIGSTRTIFGGPADLQIGAAYSDSLPTSSVPHVLEAVGRLVGPPMVMFGLLLVGFGVAPLLNFAASPEFERADVDRHVGLMSPVSPADQW